MSVDLKRLQQLAEAVGWKITRNISKGGWYLNTKSCCSWHLDLTPIRARLEAEYRKLAEQAQRTIDISRKLQGSEPWESQQAAHFTRIADELAVNEPTMVEKLRETRDAFDNQPTTSLILDALIDLYERKEK